MTTVSMPPAERARKSVQVVLQHLQQPGKAGDVAAAMGVSDSTVSRIKTERLDEVMTLLAHLGLKVVPTTHRCINHAAYEFLVRVHERVMAEAPQLIWEQAE